MPFFVGRSNSVRLCYHIDADCRRHASSPRNLQELKNHVSYSGPVKASFPSTAYLGQIPSKVHGSH